MSLDAPEWVMVGMILTAIAIAIWIESQAAARANLGSESKTAASDEAIAPPRAPVSELSAEQQAQEIVNLFELDDEAKAEIRHRFEAYAHAVRQLVKGVPE